MRDIATFIYGFKRFQNSCCRGELLRCLPQPGQFEPLVPHCGRL